MPAVANARRLSTFRWQVGLILVASALLYLIGNERVSLWDRDEPRYAQTSRQMLQSGDWVVPRFLSDIRTAKPIFIYWCQAISMKIFGDTTFAARFPSAIAMLATISFLAIVLPPRIGQQRTALTALILATSGLAIAAAKMCVTDAVLLLWITIAQACLFAIIYERGNWRTWIVMGIAIGLAGLTKGPVVLGVMGTTLIVLSIIRWNERRLRRRRSRNESVPVCDAASGAVLNYERRGQVEPFSFSLNPRDFLKFLVALGIVAAICAPWLILIHHRAPEFLPRIIGHDVVARMKSGLEGHKAPPGFYLFTIWGTYFPWSLFLPAAIAFGWQRRANPLVRFALASVIGPWLMFEVVQTKLVHYVLPIFPPLALLTARAFAIESVRMRRKRRAHAPRDWTEVLFLCIVAGWCGMVIAITAGLLYVTIWYARIGSIVPAILILIIGLELARSTFVAWRARKPLFATAVIGVGMMLIIGIGYGFYLPHVWQLQTSRRVADVLRAERATGLGSVIMIDYKEPSLAFYEGGTIREESNNAFLRDTDPLLWPRWIVITRRLWDTQPSGVRDRFDVIDSISGWWYPNGARVVDVLVLRKR